MSADKLPSNPSATLRALNPHLFGSLPVSQPMPIQQSEPATKWQKGEERKLHDLFKKYATLRGWYCVNSRFDKPSTIRKGTPDFIVAFGKSVVFIEFKAEGGKLDQEQKECIAELTAAGVPVLVAYDLQSAIDFAVKNLTHQAP